MDAHRWTLKGHDGQSDLTLKAFIYERIFSTWTDQFMASFAYALGYAGVILLLVLPLERLKLHIRA